MKKSINSAEIAKIAGVSRSTVSRVVNNYGNVTEETREKVRKIIKEYNYVPHASAQMLAGKKNNIIGLFVVDTKKNSNKMSTSSYFSPFTNIVIDEANKKHYKVLIEIINDKDGFKSAKNLFYNKTIVGGIFIGSNNNEVHIEKIIKDGYKVAVIEQESVMGIFSKAIIVNSDSYTGSYEAVKYLTELGHKKIAYISGDESHWTTRTKTKGYMDALNDAGITVDEKLIIKGDYTEESGYIASKEILRKNQPTAMFVGNDSMTLGVYNAVRELGMSIPDDISVVGFDDIEIARYLQPGLTTVRVPLYNMASIAVEKLFQEINKPQDLQATYNIPVKLIKRESCKAVE